MGEINLLQILCTLQICEPRIGDFCAREIQFTQEFRQLQLGKIVVVQLGIGEIKYNLNATTDRLNLLAEVLAGRIPLLKDIWFTFSGEGRPARLLRSSEASPPHPERKRQRMRMQGGRAAGEMVEMVMGFCRCAFLDCS